RETVESAKTASLGDLPDPHCRRIAQNIAGRTIVSQGQAPASEVVESPRGRTLRAIQLAIEIFTPSAARVRLRPAVVDVIWITTPFWFFIAATLPPPPSVAPAATDVNTPLMSCAVRRP